MGMRKSRLSKIKKERLIEHFLLAQRPVVRLN
jgi:hypothetical protein